MTLPRIFLLASCLVMRFGAVAQENAGAEPGAPPGSGGAKSQASQPAPDRRARLALLSPVSSKSPTGSSFMAKVETLVEVEGKALLPAGTLVEGHLETAPAARPMRRGALRMIFDRVKLPDGTVRPARLELSSVESNSAKADNEGAVHPTVSKKRLAIQLGGTAAVAKLADDLSEEALAAGAGSARWYGLAASTAFLLLQKGREVKLKPGDVIEVDLIRDGVALPTGATQQPQK